MRLVSGNCEAGRYLLALSVVALLAVLIYSVFPVFFETNDDVYMMFTMAGYITGEPTASTAYSNELLGGMISGLYRISGYLPWYTLFHIGMIFASEILLCKTFLKIGSRLMRNALLPAGLYLVFSLIFLLYAKVRMQYTLSAAIAGSTGIALLWGISEADGQWCKRIDAALAVLFLWLGYAIRPGFFPIMLCFLLLVLVYQLIVFTRANTRREVRVLMMVSGAGAALVLLAMVVGMLGKATVAWREFEAYNAYRTRYSDYPNPTFEEAQDLYASVQWTPELVRLTRSGFNMDRRINTDALKTITAYADTQWKNGGSRSAKDAAVETAKLLYRTIRYDRSAWLVVTAIGISFAAVLIDWIRQKRRWRELLLPICIVGELIALCALLCFRQRFMLRAFLFCAIPAGVLLVPCVCGALARGGKKFAAIVVLPLLLGLANVQWIANADTTHATQIARAHDAMEAYCIAHPENKYIYDISLADDQRAFVTYPDQKPVNLFFWGGWEMHSPMQKQQLKLSGLTELYADAFFAEDVYLMTAAPNTAGLMEYMRKEYGAVGYDVVEEMVEGVLVVHFF